MNKLILVARRQYTQTIRKPSFWIVTLLLPAFIVVVSFISGYSADQTEKKVAEELKNVDRILVYDEADVIDTSFYNTPYFKISTLQDGLDEIKNSSADALFEYRDDFEETLTVYVYTEDEGLVSKGKFDKMVQSLVRQSILQRIGDPDAIRVFNSPLSVETTYYKNGEVFVQNVEDFIVPAVSLVLYFVLVFMGTNFLLMSVSEEKENRMIEVILTTMRPQDLVWGKILGLVSIVVTQIIILVTIALVGISATGQSLHLAIDWTAVPIDPVQIGLNLSYILAGFMMIATVMVGVGAAMPTYREAQQFSSIFIILAIIPIYFITLIVAEPNGSIARVTSYLPLTSPLVLLARSALGALPLWEGLLSAAVNVVYVIGGFILAFKLFEIGSLQYNQKVDFTQLFKKKDD